MGGVVYNEETEQKANKGRSTPTSTLFIFYNFIFNFYNYSQNFYHIFTPHLHTLNPQFHPNFYKTLSFLSKIGQFSSRKFMKNPYQNNKKP